MPAPIYDRSAVEVGIVHIGVGGFHRAHQAVYVDELLERGDGDGWGICGVGLLPGDVVMRDVLQAQDGRYTVVVKHPDGRLEPRVVGSMVRYLHAPDDPEAVLDVLADPRTRIVSLTITEGGYVVGPDAQEDSERDGPPTTVFGYVVEALRRRRAAGVAAFTVMSCDNLPGNGKLARSAFAEYAELIDPELAQWVQTEMAFPDSMVDRITPVTTDADRAMVRERLGIDDGWPVVCEDFRQWVLEDDFPTGRPDWERVGVQMVDEVEPYELMKLRLLNASHQALAYAGHLLGHRMVDEAATDPDLVELVRGYMAHEAVPTLAPVPGIDLADYQHTLLERFANPAVGDTIARLCADSSNRIPPWLLPVIRENLAAGGQVRRSAMVVACWARYAEGVDEQDRPIDVVDADVAEVQRAARAQDERSTAFLEQRRHFGDLVDDARFRSTYLAAVTLVRKEGVRGALRQWNQSAAG
jgi:mannitol 2-dehydrogenase